jgi:hypothetical protein
MSTVRVTLAALTFAALPSLASAQDVTGPTSQPSAAAVTTDSSPVREVEVVEAQQAGDEMQAIQERLTALEEKSGTTDALMKKLKISAYAQARYEARQNAVNGLDATGKPGLADTFNIRRGRLKFTFAANKWSTLVISPDFASKGFTLKDLYIDLNDQWTKTHKLRVGQFNVPYGYEIEESSSAREMPERSRWERVLFPGERDRGAAIYGDLSPLVYSLGVMNGNMSADRDANFTGVDHNFAKQYLARVGIETGGLQAGVSGSHNIKLIPAVAPDLDAGIRGHGNKEYTERLAGVYLVYERELPYLGDFALKGEYNRGWTGIFADEFGTTKPGHLKPERRAKMLGWHVLVSQFVTANNQLAYRIEQFDPDLESRDKDCNTAKHAATDFCHFSRITVHTVAWNYFFKENVRITTALEIPRQPAWKDKQDNTFTEQVQYKF